MTSFLPGLNLAPGPLVLCLQLIVASTKFSDSLFREELFQSPLLNILGLVLFKLSNEGNGALEDGTLVLFAARNNFGKFIDTLVNSLTAASFNYS